MKKRKVNERGFAAVARGVAVRLPGGDGLDVEAVKKSLAEAGYGDAEIMKSYCADKGLCDEVKRIINDARVGIENLPSDDLVKAD
jgi:hypothetical protein